MVATKLTKYTHKNLFVSDANEYAGECMKALGVTKLTAGSLWHEIQTAPKELIPLTILEYLLEPIYFYHRKRLDSLS